MREKKEQEQEQVEGKEKEEKKRGEGSAVEASPATCAAEAMGEQEQKLREKMTEEQKSPAGEKRNEAVLHRRFTLNLIFMPFML